MLLPTCACSVAAFHSGVYEHVDCTQPQQVLEVLRRHEIGVIYHLAAMLSAVAEEKPHAAWNINMGGLYNVLEAARQYRCEVFFPSSIGAFGPSTPRDHTPQLTIQRPTTMYGVTKVAGELLCDYYANRFGVDVRGLRLPGLISYVAPPGGGSTDYAVEIFYQALRYKHYSCLLGADTRLAMMYMPDAIQAMIQLMRCTASIQERLQCDRDEHHASRACRRDPQARSRVCDRLSRRSRATVDRRHLAALARCKRCEAGLGFHTAVRSRVDDGRHA